MKRIFALFLCCLPFGVAVANGDYITAAVWGAALVAVFPVGEVTP